MEVCVFSHVTFCSGQPASQPEARNWCSRRVRISLDVPSVAGDGINKLREALHPLISIRSSPSSPPHSPPPLFSRLLRPTLLPCFSRQRTPLSPIHSLPNYPSRFPHSFLAPGRQHWGVWGSSSLGLAWRMVIAYYAYTRFRTHFKIDKIALRGSINKTCVKITSFKT